MAGVEEIALEAPRFALGARALVARTGEPCVVRLVDPAVEGGAGDGRWFKATSYWVTTEGDGRWRYFYESELVAAEGAGGKEGA